VDRSGPWLRLLGASHAWPKDLLYSTALPSGVSALPPFPASPVYQDMIAVGDEVGIIRICSIKTGEVISLEGEALQWEAHTGAIQALAWHPTDGRIASYGEDHTLAVWQPLQQLEPLWRSVPLETVKCIAWHEDGRIASGSDAGLLAVWRYWDDESLKFGIRFRYHGVESVAWHSDGRLAVGTQNYWCSEPFFTPLWYSWPFGEWGIDPDAYRDSDEAQEEANLFIFCPELNEDVLWSCRQGYSVNCVTWHQNGQLASSMTTTFVRDGLTTSDPDMAVWLTEPDGRALRMIWNRKNLSTPQRLAWHPNGQLASCHNQGGTYIWQPAETMESKRPLWRGFRSGTCTDINWHSRDGLISLSQIDADLAYWRPVAGINSNDEHTREEEPEEAWESGDVLDRVAWHPDGKRLASGAGSGWVTEWAFEDGFTKSTWHELGHNTTRTIYDTIAGLAYHFDGRLASCGSDSQVVIWSSTGDQSNVHILNFAGEGNLVCLAWNLDGHLAVAAADWIKVWTSPEQGDLLWSAEGLPDDVFLYGDCLGWTPNNLLASGYTNMDKSMADVPSKTINLWDPEDKSSHIPEWQSILHGEASRRMECLHVHSSGDIASAYDDGTLAVWRPAFSNAPVLRVRTSTAGLRQVQWSPDAQWLAVSTDDSRVLIYRVRADDLQRAFQFGADAPVLALWWSPDSRELRAADDGGGSGRPRVYRLALEGVAPHERGPGYSAGRGGASTAYQA